MEALEFFGEILGQSKCFYVATTYAANQLERIAAYGLGARGNGQILIFSEGVLIIRNGEVPLAIPRQAIIGVETTQVTIDKAVEPGGLISIQWIQEKTELATQLRIVDTDSRKIILSNISNLLAGSNSGRVAK